MSSFLKRVNGLVILLINRGYDYHSKKINVKIWSTFETEWFNKKTYVCVITESISRRMRKLTMLKRAQYLRFCKRSRMTQSQVKTHHIRWKLAVLLIYVDCITKIFVKYGEYSKTIFYNNHHMGYLWFRVLSLI